jgi:hypothetical protein
MATRPDRHRMAAPSTLPLPDKLASDARTSFKELWLLIARLANPSGRTKATQLEADQKQNRTTGQVVTRGELR